MNTLRVFVFFIIFILFSLASCQWENRTADEAIISWLHDVHRLAQKDGRLAATRLDSLGMPRSPYAQSLWCLVRADANNQQHLPVADSLLQTAAGYLTQYSTVEERFSLLRLQGGWHEAQDEAPDAARYYLRALELAREAGDYALQCQAHHLLGTLYAYAVYLRQDAIDEYRQCLHIAREHHVDKWLGAANLCMGRPYLMAASGDALFSRWREGVAYYEEGMRYAKEGGYDWVYVAARSELAALYLKHGEAEQALQLHLSAEEDSQRLQPNFRRPFYLGLMDTYLALNRLSDAQPYIDTLLAENSVAGRYDVYVALYNYHQLRGEYERCVFYNDSVYHYYGLRTKQNLSKQIADVRARYDQQKIINEKNQMRIERDIAVGRGGVIFGVLVFAIVFFVYMYIRRLHRNRELLRRHILVRQQNTQLIQRNEDLIARLQAQISNVRIQTDLQGDDERQPQAEGEQMEVGLDLQNQLNEQQTALAVLQEQTARLRAENLSLQQSIDSNRHHPSAAELEATDSRLRYLEERERELTEKLVNNNELVLHLREKPKFLQETEWVKLRDIIDCIYSRFTDRLRMQYPQLTEVDVQLCILIKLRFTVSQIAIFTAVSPASVSVQKNRLKKRLLQTDATLFDDAGRTLDIYIWEY